MGNKRPDGFGNFPQFAGFCLKLKAICQRGSLLFFNCIASYTRLETDLIPQQLKLKRKMEKIGPEVYHGKAAFVHPSAHMYGKIHLEEGVSVWPQVVMRAESYQITIGAHSNVQDFVLMHVGETTGTHIGSYCSITHHCVIHGATIGDNCLIGIGAKVVDGCVVGENSIVAGGSFLKEGTVIPANSIVAGTPGKVIRTQNNWVANRYNAWIYHRNALSYAKGFYRIWADEEFQKAGKTEMERLQKEFLQSPDLGREG